MVQSVSLSGNHHPRRCGRAVRLFLGAGHGLDVRPSTRPAQAHHAIPQDLLRTDAVLTHGIQQVPLRDRGCCACIHRLEAKDLALNCAAISLGSCTMKLNATAEMIPVTWPEFGKLHPSLRSRPRVTSCCWRSGRLAGEGDRLMRSACSPTPGLQEECAVLLAIKRYHESRGEGASRCLPHPASAHGTKPGLPPRWRASKVIVTACDKAGNVDLDDLRAKAAEVGDQLSCLMVTYPSTHGVYEETIRRCVTSFTSMVVRFTSAAPT